MTRKRTLILASRSPARRQLLREAGYEIKLSFPDVDESRRTNEDIKKFAIRIATDKAQKVAKRRPDSVIIAVDTIIIYRNEIYGKPANKKEAKELLKRLSGKWHEVYSGTVVLDSATGKISKKLVSSRVKFAKLSDKLIDWYVSTGEPMKAAGGYSIQNRGRILIESVDGCITNIIGISIPIITKMLEPFNVI